MASNLNQGIYSPLPQSLSDSDSDKETSTDVLRPKFVNRHVHNGMHDNYQHNGYINQAGDLKSGHKMTSKMSPIRKCCFVFSIALCFLTVIVFVWVLPCSENGTCPIRISNWENQHDGVELTGRINVVKSAFKHTLNLALLFKHSLNSADSQSGAISVLGTNGAVAWYIPQIQTPSDMDCSLIDVNKDDITDCLLLGKMGLEAVDPLSGSILWHVHNHQFQSKIIANLDFPIIVPDMNSDNVNEIVTSSNSNANDTFGIILVVCGRTGMVLSQFSVKRCYNLHIEAKDDTNVICSCRSGTNLTYYSITMDQLRKRVQDKSFKVEPIKIKYEHVPKSGYVLNGRKLIINNLGTCPEKCQSSIILLDEKSKKEIYTWSYPNSYAMKPTSFSFQQTKSNLVSLKGHINGYILKLWQWSGYNRNKKQMNESAYSIAQKPKRNVAFSSNSTQVNAIMERIVLITFNDTNVHVINASLTDITQLCFLSENMTNNCQPDLRNQNNSLLICDLDMDGSQELVSYSSTFVRKEDSDSFKENWQLVSSMKVIRLEAELPKLYEAAK